jgi:phospholipid-translocating ATPase
VPYGAFVNGIDYQGKDMNDYSLLAFCIFRFDFSLINCRFKIYVTFSALIVAVTGQIMFDTAYWTIFNHIAIFGSVLLFIVIVIVFYEGNIIALPYC